LESALNERLDALLIDLPHNKKNEGRTYLVVVGLLIINIVKVKIVFFDVLGEIHFVPMGEDK
jgi:hypothetical protein